MASAGGYMANTCCRICYQQSPTDRELLNVGCKSDGHPPLSSKGDVLVTWSEKKGLLVQVRPLPSPPRVSRPYTLCNKGAACPGVSCVLAHSEEELLVWTAVCEEMRQRGASAVQPLGGTGQCFSRTDVKIEYKERILKPPCLEHAQAALTRETYRSKFYSLLYHEEEFHSSILANRCDGEYLLVIFERGYIPDWAGSRAERGKGNLSSRYACVSGMTMDQIMYATQASECLLVVNQSKHVQVEAKILPANFSSYYDELLVEFLDSQVSLLEKNFNVVTNECEKKLMMKFEVKHLYFDMLHRSLRSLSDEQVARVIPSSSDTFTGGSCGIPYSIIYDFMALDKASQKPALSLVINSKPRAPVLVTGAFGTGKTRLLAVATHFFIEEGKRKNMPTRVLLCAHHQATADSMVDYLGKMLSHKKHPWQATVVRLTRINYHEADYSKYKRLFVNFANFRGLFTNQIVQRHYVVIVTTCLTALNASAIIGSDYFTHILLDEAAQVREPEAVAPLCMANQNTKIVIAGDDCQVGPEILVLGEVPQVHGLATSLITRLLKLYKQFNFPVARLSTNYRCNEAIVKLAHSLSYTDRLTACASPEDTTIPGISQPLWFVCSSLDKKLAVDKESDSQDAKALTDHVRIFFPDSEDGVCILGSNRRQLSDIRFKMMAFSEERRYDWKKLEFLPTYQIQGREFKALFMSTVESLDPSGCSYNPTKSLCSSSVFNTAITRAKSLIVAVGNPYTLMSVEEKMGKNKYCWAEFIHRCFMLSTVVFPAETKEEDIGELQDVVLGMSGIKPPYPPFHPLAPIRLTTPKSASASILGPRLHSAPATAASKRKHKRHKKAPSSAASKPPPKAPTKPTSKPTPKTTPKATDKTTTQSTPKTNPKATATTTATTTTKAVAEQSTNKSLPSTVSKVTKQNTLPEAKTFTSIPPTEPLPTVPCTAVTPTPASKASMENGVPLRIISSYFVVGKDIFLGLNSSRDNLTAKIFGPSNTLISLANLQSQPQTVLWPKIVGKGSQGCVVQLPAQTRPGAYAVLFSHSVNSPDNEAEPFLLNIFDPSAVRIQLIFSLATCLVNQELHWLADCSSAGPGLLACTVNGDYVTVEQFLNGRHIIHFTPRSVGLYILEVTYNGYHTGNTLSFHVQ